MLPAIVNRDTGDETVPGRVADCAAPIKCFGCDAREGCTHACSICHEPWEDHYRDGAKWKMGPYGTFDLIADHTPHIPGVHAERN